MQDSVSPSEHQHLCSFSTTWKWNFVFPQETSIVFMFAIFHNCVHLRKIVAAIIAWMFQNSSHVFVLCGILHVCHALIMYTDSCGSLWSINGLLCFLFKCLLSFFEFFFKWDKKKMVPGISYFHQMENQKRIIELSEVEPVPHSENTSSGILFQNA